jgi:hypothetical protein
MPYRGEPPPIDRNVAAALAFWVCFALISSFIFTHAQWYDVWETHDRLDFWVAIGTLALAITTAGSVFVTAATMSEEHHRYRQSVAPLIRIGLAKLNAKPGRSSGLIAKNIGTGPALHIRIRAEFVDGTTPFRELVAGLGIGEERSVNIGREVTFSREIYGTIKVSYEDVFGNIYGTEYTNFQKLEFRYIRPERLR